MVNVSVNGEFLHLEVEGMDKIWALKSALEIRLSRIQGAHRAPSLAIRGLTGLRSPGTYLPGVIAAGSFYQDGKRIFWDVRDAARAIVIELEEDRYDELIVEVEDPAAAVDLIQRSLAGAHGTTH